MRRLLLAAAACLTATLAQAQGRPFIRNYTPQDYQANSIGFDIEMDDEDHVFIANFEGLLYYDHATWRILRTPGITRVTVVFKDKAGNIWVGGYNYFGAIVRKPNGDIRMARIAPPDLFRGEVQEIFEEGNHVRFMVGDGTIYQVGNDGVKLYKSSNRGSLHVGLNVVDLNALNNQEDNVIYEELEFELEGGIAAIYKKNSGLTIADHGKELYRLNESFGLSSNIISYAQYDGKGQLWTVTEKGISTILLPSAFSQFGPADGLLGSVLCMKRYGGKIFVGTDDALYMLEGRLFRKVEGIRHACWDIYAGPKGLLAATADGIFRVNTDGTTRQLTNIDATAVLEDDDCIYSGEMNALYAYDNSGKKREVSSLESVKRIVKDKDGTIWIQNIYGLIAYKTAAAKTFAFYQGKKNDETAHTLVDTGGKVDIISAESTDPFPYPLFSYTDDEGVCWLTNNEGKELYRWKDGRRLNDYPELLFPLHGVAVRAMLHINNEIWVGTETGITVINLKADDPTRRFTPKLRINTVTLRSDSVLWGGFGTMPEALPELASDENNLYFTFSLNYSPIIGQTLYRYRLDDGAWSAWSPVCTAHFVNLSPGSYTFSVEARDAMNRKTDIASIDFTIQHPFYLRWYMNILYLLLLGYVFYLLFRLRLQRLEKDKQRLESIVQERTAEVVKQKDEIEEKSKSLETALQELGEAQHELIRQEKMATVGKLTHGLIDRILNPLNYINNFSKLSEGLVRDVRANIEDEKENMDEDNYEDTIDVLDMLSGNLQKVGEHGQNTTRTLKAMEEMLKDRTGGIVPTDLATILRTDKEQLEEYFKKDIAQYGIKVSFDYPGHMPIAGNPDQLSKTIMSLLGNAVYALVKKAQRESYTPEITLKAEATGGGYTVSVRDNGIGIEEKILGNIFDPFFTTKTTGEASGVGLYLSREIIQNHGGDIHATSVKDEYSEFTFTLPALKA